MDRTRIVVIAALLALAGVALPLATAVHLAQQRAVAAEQRYLQQLARKALDRAQQSFADARSVLREMQATPLAPCSDAHVRLMRALTLRNRNTDDIGFFNGDQLACTSAGAAEPGITRSKDDFITADGIGVSLDLAPQASPGIAMVGMALGHYKLLIHPVRFADVLAEPEIDLAIALSDGRLLGSLREPLPEGVRRLLQTGQADDTLLYALERDEHLIAVAAEPRSRVLTPLQREMRWLLPLGALMAALIVAVVAWGLRRRLSPLGELKMAVARREFVVHYQPLIELATGRCIGAEALVRWRRPDGSLVRPDLFIPLAEDSGLVLPITDQVIAEVVREMRAALTSDRELHIAINLSAQDIRSGRVLAVLAQALQGSGIAPQQIWLEATERGFMDADAARATINRARAAGHAVAIDDFGTGYSSLAYLQGFALDALKIDKSFIDTIGAETVTSSVTPHIIDMAQALGLQVVAEGVETQAQADYLRERRVQFAQGWLFAKALPAAEFLAFARSRQAKAQGQAGA